MWISALVRGVGPVRAARAHVEGTEADQVDALAGLQGPGDRTDHTIDGTAGIGLGQAGTRGNGFDQFILVHWTGNSLCVPLPLDADGRIAPAHREGLPGRLAQMQVRLLLRGCRRLYQWGMGLRTRKNR